MAKYTLDTQIERLYNITHKRFDDIEQIENYLGIGNIGDDTQESTAIDIDFCLTGCLLEENDRYFDFDLFYLKDRAGKIYITELNTRF